MNCKLISVPQRLAKIAVPAIKLIARPSNVNAPKVFAVRIARSVLMDARTILVVTVALVLAVQMAQNASVHRDTRESIVRFSIISVR